MKRQSCKKNLLPGNKLLMIALPVGSCYPVLVIFRRIFLNHGCSDLLLDESLHSDLQEFLTQHSIVLHIMTFGSFF